MQGGVRGAQLDEVHAAGARKQRWPWVLSVYSLDGASAEKSRDRIKTWSPLLFRYGWVCVHVCACSCGTANPPGTECEVCQDIIKPLKHMITIP